MFGPMGIGAVAELLDDGGSSTREDHPLSGVSTYTRIHLSLRGWCVGGAGGLGRDSAQRQETAI